MKTSTKSQIFKSALRYGGGKTRFVGELDKWLPNTEFDEYREPFVGGGAYFYHLRNTRPSIKHWWINDVYAALIDFYKLAADPESCKRLVDQVLRMHTDYPTLEDRKELHARLKSEPLTGATFFVLNRITFSGTIEMGGFSSSAAMDRFTLSSIERLKTLPEALKDVKITCDDYSEALLSPAKGTGALVYLDPPYYGVDGIYKHGTLSHDRLADDVRKSPHQVVLSYDDHPHIRDLYSWANIYETGEVAYGMSRKRAKELIICNGN